jgi:hypothetical protein
MFQKISLWGSVASIVGVVTIFLPGASTAEQIIHGSGNIQGGGNVEHNTIIINPPSQALPPKEKFAYLNHENGGTTWLFNKPALQDVKVLCQAEAGSKAKLLEEKDSAMYGMTWVKVKVLDGSCQGTVGWTGKDDYRQSQGF